MVQPVPDGSEYVMRVWESTDGGQTFHGERDVATIGYGYDGVPRLAVAEDGEGWLTFKDDGGLELANLGALPVPSPPTVPKSESPTPPASTPKSAPAPKPAPTFAVIAAHSVGDQLLQLLAPTACTATGSQLSLKALSLRHAGSHLTKYEVDHVAFYINGGLKRKVLVGKPPHRRHQTVYEPQYQAGRLPSTFAFLPSKIGAHPGSNSVLVKITLVTHIGKAKRGKNVKLTKTLRSSFEVCGA